MKKAEKKAEKKGKIESILGFYKKGISTPIISEALNISEKRVQEIIKIGKQALTLLAKMTQHKLRPILIRI